MNPLHMLSAVIRLVALIWAIGLTRRYHDWRFGALAAWLAVLLVNPVRALLFDGAGRGPHVLGVDGLWGLIVALFALLAVFLLGRAVAYHRGVADDLARSHRILQLVMDTIPQRLFWKDLDHRYAGCNKAAAKDAGLDTPEEIVGKTDFELAWKHLAEQYRRDDEAVIASKRSRLNYEEPLIRDDGSTRWVRTTKVPLRDETGEVIGLFGSYEDITERKRAEEERERLEAHLRQAQKMETVGQLAGGIAHDFNNLLTAIQGHAELLIHEAAVPERWLEDLEEIRKASRRGASLTQQLLAFSRRQVLVPSTLDLNELLSGVLDMLKRLAGPSIELELERDPELGLVRADPGQLEEVMISLVVNSRDAMPAGGRILIRTRNAELDRSFVDEHPGARSGSYVAVSVRDDGEGMDEGTLEHAFEPFFTTKTLGVGTGLGLSMVYGIVKQSDGYVWLESEPGRGTVCTVYLPRVEGDAARKPEPKERLELEGGSETILLLDDTDQVRRLVGRVLRKRGYSVITTGDPEEAVEIAAAHEGPLHLLIADLVLPKMSGREAAERIRAQRPEVRVLYISGYTEEAIFQRGLLEPDVAFLRKPFSMEELLTTVGRMLRTS